MKKPKRLTPAQRRRTARAAAMPAVKALVRKFGRANVSNCVGQIREREKTLEQIASLKKEAARLSRKT
jgi:hypothetical protein